MHSRIFRLHCLSIEKLCCVLKWINKVGIFLYLTVFQIWKCFKIIFLWGGSLEMCRRSGDEDRVSAAFIKTNGFQPDGFWFRMSMKKKKLVSVNNTEWLTVKRTLLVPHFDRLGASDTRCSMAVPKHFRDQRDHETYCRLTEKEGLVQITFYTRLTFYSSRTHDVGVYNAVGAWCT